jgi:hypothetical protein
MFKFLKALLYTVIVIFALLFLLVLYILFPNETGFTCLGILVIVCALGIYQILYDKFCK